MGRTMGLKSLSFLALLALGACATGLSEQACLTGDAESIGFDDGRRGRMAASVLDRVEQCARYELAFDQSAYRAGWAQGNQFFCTPTGALTASLAGEGDLIACAAPDALTIEGYSVGRRVAAAQREYDNAQRRIDSLRSTIRSGRYQIDRVREKIPLIDNEDRRNELRADAERARRNIRNARRELPFARSAQRQAERELYAAQTSLSIFRSRLRGYDGRADGGFPPLITAP